MKYKNKKDVQLSKNNGFLYTMIRRVSTGESRDGDSFLEILAHHLAEGRREHSFLKECQLCDIGVVKKNGHTELRYYMWCSNTSEQN